MPVFPEGELSGPEAACPDSPPMVPAVLGRPPCAVVPGAPAGPLLAVVPPEEPLVPPAPLWARTATDALKQRIETSRNLRSIDHSFWTHVHRSWMTSK